MCHVWFGCSNITSNSPAGKAPTQFSKRSLKISEEEFGLHAGGPITLPFDSVFLEYLIELIKRQMDGDTEKAF
ncbi:unnamed protein product [Eruca vesicaria subsp. sativa]|uniref:Uncharacterized protein n=1 Tax=Eruca vesicaria subsp. sativa TaxID=29727 RepID=A0ABC8KIK7_ERUVS|nr:unnamed protein product [Eruca vesicaria subsp. sativa]